MNIGFGIRLGGGNGGVVSYPNVSQFYGAGGIKIHYDAALGVTSSSSRVSAWADQSGNGNNLIQPTGANQPLLVASATPANTPAVQLDSTARAMAKGSASTTQANAAVTLFLVVQVTGNGLVWRHSNGTATTGVDYIPGSGNRRVTCLGSTSTADGAYSALFEVICWRLAAAGGYGTALTTNDVLVNAALQTAPTGTPNLTQGTVALLLGIAGSSSLCSITEIAEAPDSLLSLSDCIAISRGLMRKHGIT